MVSPIFRAEDGRCHGCATQNREGILTMQWDSVTSTALRNIELAVEGIAAADATLKSLSDAQNAIEEQKRIVRTIRQAHVANRNKAMDAALDGDLPPEAVAARGNVKVTAMYKGIADTTGKKRRR